MGIDIDMSNTKLWNFSTKITCQTLHTRADFDTAGGTRDDVVIKAFLKEFSMSPRELPYTCVTWNLK